MWIIALIMFHGMDYKVASNQLVYPSYDVCEKGRLELIAKLEATKPPEGKVLSKCVQMTEGTNA